MKKLLLFLLFFFPFTRIFASYEYENIHTEITILPNTSITISETQTFVFQGEYHKAWRTIPHKRLDAITNVRVLDEQHTPLTYSQKQLDKTNPDSWGKYTVYKKDNTTYIEWYYDATDTKKTWNFEYTVHGAIEFLDETDRVYWNIFTDYDVPVELATATISLPANAISVDAYRNSTDLSIDNNNPVIISGINFLPGEPFTVDIQLPKGFLDRSKYWSWFVSYYRGYIISALSIIITIIAIFIFWLRHEKLPKGRGVITPEYKPPQNLPPAIAEVIAYERLSSKGLTATVVDLAVRGYLIISEEKRSLFSFSKNYSITLTQKDQAQLRLYEKKYIDFLFEDNTTITTTALKSRVGNKYASQFNKLKETIYEEANVDKKIFDVDMKKENWKSIFIFLLLFGGFYIFAIGNQLLFTMIIIILCALTYVIFTRFEARLSKEGRILRDDWLGFRMYLETAEKLQLQKLTPKTFETFLPYAMVFGVEKKWAKAFESMAIILSAPTWYTGSHVTTHSFSPSGFSTSFSASFSSSFGSSGGGGSSGGSGGGGGGGGGGGAS